VTHEHVINYQSSRIDNVRVDIFVSLVTTTLTSHPPSNGFNLIANALFLPLSSWRRASTLEIQVSQRATDLAALLTTLEQAQLQTRLTHRLRNRCRHPCRNTRHR
jgi:hypothetical protein